MSTPSRPLPPKKDVALALLQGPSLYIHLDPRKPEVLVPPYFKKQPQLVLQVGLNMAIPIPDLKVDDEGVTCTLSFNRKPFWCRMPWTAVFALVGEDMKGMVWPDEVPAEVAAQRDVKPVPSPVAETKPARVRAARDGSRKRTAPEGVPQAKKLAVVPGPSAGAGAQQANLPFGNAHQGAASRSQQGSGAPSTALPHGPAARDGDAPAPSAPKRDSAKTGKRDLPPYLRIVK
jgi:stringent starvation protein B